MSDVANINDRIMSRRTGASDDDPDAFDDCGAFGFLRGVKDRAAMLDIRFKNGNREAFPYALLERVSFDPSEGLLLRYFGISVKIQGRNLMRPSASGVSLLDAIHRHRVPWVAEVDELHDSVNPSNSVVITRIELVVTK